ncbi:MAG: ATP-binding cassette domain-containing protein [Anaerolineae bacterium]
MAHQHCPNCWRQLADPEAQYCQHCGVNLQEWQQADERPQLVTNPIALTKTPITIGRDEASDIHLDHPAVSAQHARLEWRAQMEAWYVVDEVSAKGTFVNYQQVPHGPEGRPVNPATDTIWIAPYSFRLVGGEQQQPRFEPARLRLDAVDLVRTVKHDQTKRPITILDLRSTPLSFRPGEFIALVGGSGAGKSTLMKALLGLAPAQQGTVYVSGRPFIEKGQAQRFEAMHAIVGYVPQEDIVHRELTALEAMDYTAQFRLSPDLSKRERTAYIQRTLQTVELWEHRDKLIRRLSGGQRKRVNIALELLAQPRLLFLDEPTSGLDPGLDLSIMELLRDWATDPIDPRTIVLVTHATENVTNCKYVAFMAPGGYVVYFGPPEKALTYFGVPRFAEIYRQVSASQGPPAAAGDGDGSAQSGGAPEMVTRFRNSQDHFHYVEARRLDATDLTPTAETAEAAPRRSHGGVGQAERELFWRQFRVLTARYWKLIRRDRMNFVTLLLQGFLVAGLLWAVARPDVFQPKGAENAQTLLFIMACAAAWLGILNGTKEIVKEQDIYARERRYGLTAAPYVLSKLVVLAAVGLVQMGTLLLIVSYRFTLPDRGALAMWSPTWLEWCITLELTLTAGVALGLFLSASTATVDAATAVMFVLLLIQVMFAGLFFPDARWADILSIFTFSRWGLEAAGTTANLNGLLKEAIGSTYQADKAYTFSALHLLARWAILGTYTAVFTILASSRQARKP